MNIFFGLLALLVMLFCLFAGFYYLWQVSQLLITVGFSAPTLAYNLGSYIQYLIATVITGVIAQILFAMGSK